MLAEFEPIYLQMGELGWAQHEVDLMDCWLVARFMGLLPGTDRRDDPVVRGSRGLTVGKDKSRPRRSGPPAGPWQDPTLKARIAAGRPTGRVVRNTDG